LRTVGCTVAIAAAGKEALRRARERSPDLLVLDLLFPGELSGLELLRQLRAPCPANCSRP
jgi:CheY-like chemotaxis protein